MLLVGVACLVANRQEEGEVLLPMLQVLHSLCN